MKKFIAIFMVLATLLLTVGCQQAQEKTSCPSCGEEVFATKYCGECGQPLSAGNNTDELVATEGLEYTLLDDNTYSVSVGTAITFKDIVIPSQYNGKLVTEIAKEGFSYTDITSIVIPGSVITIKEDAFEDCTNLKNVTLSYGVKTIDDTAFNGCTSLTNINVDKNNPNYSSEDGVLFNKNKTTLICYPTGITTPRYTIPDGVTEIGYAAFRGCKSLNKVIIPDSVTVIGEYAFYNCSNLTSINIPDSVTDLSYSSFEGTKIRISLEDPVE